MRLHFRSLPEFLAQFPLGEETHGNSNVASKNDFFFIDHHNAGKGRKFATKSALKMLLFP